GSLPGLGGRGRDGRGRGARGRGGIGGLDGQALLLPLDAPRRARRLPPRVGHLLLVGARLLARLLHLAAELGRVRVVRREVLRKDGVERVDERLRVRQRIVPRRERVVERDARDDGGEEGHRYLL